VAAFVRERHGRPGVVSDLLLLLEPQAVARVCVSSAQHLAECEGVAHRVAVRVVVEVQEHVFAGSVPFV
jgi:hypothetical protein